MEPKFIEKEAFKVAGLQTYGGAMDNKFALMWHLLMMQDGPEIPDKVDPMPSFGVCSYVAKPSEEMGLFYMACCVVTTFDNLPPNVVGKNIPANTYAVFTHRGPLDATLKDSFQAAYEWVRASDYEKAGPYDLEFYGPEFKGPQNPESILEIWVPVKRK